MLIRVQLRPMYELSNHACSTRVYQGTFKSPKKEKVRSGLGRFQSAFVKYAKQDPYFDKALSEDADIGRGPDSDDWSQVKSLLVFLEAFYNATLRVSGTLFITSNFLFFEIVSIHKMLQYLEKVDDVIEVDVSSIMSDPEITNFKTMAKQIRIKYDKYYGTPEKMNVLIYIAVVFDPKFKLDGLELSLCDMFGDVKGKAITSMVSQKMESLFDEYWNIYKPVTIHVGQRNEPIDCEDGGQRSSSGSGYAQQLWKKLKGSDHGKGISRTELQKYLNEGLELEAGEAEDILVWWKVHGPRYPVVARMARDVLAVPVSTVASESTFSTGGRVLDSFRTSLSPKMVQALICAQDWLKVKLPTIVIELEETEELDKGGEGDFLLNVWQL